MALCQIKILNELPATNPTSDPSLALVAFQDCDGKTLKQREINLWRAEQVFYRIEHQKPIDLSDSLILNFDLESLTSNLGKNVEIKNLRAENAIFFSQKRISFSGARFTGQWLNLAKARFIAPVVSFQACEFDVTTANFHGTVFHASELDFTNSKFRSSTLDFRNAHLGNGQKNFENIDFGKTQVQFIGVDFGPGDVSFANSKFAGDKVLFRMSVFGPGRKDFSNIDFGPGQLNFEKVEFGAGDVSFKYTNFGSGIKDFRRCSFGEGKKNFNNAVFGDGPVQFIGTDFGPGKVSFKLSRFGTGQKDFHYSHFGDGDVIFDKTHFGKGSVDFRAVDFDNCRVVFNHIEVERGDIIFEASQMKAGFIQFKNSLLGAGEFNFKNLVYPQADVLIENVDFGHGSISFYLAKINRLILKSSQINNYFDLRVSFCNYLDLSDTVIKDIVDLQQHQTRSEINNLDLRGVRLLGRIYVDWHQLRLKQLILKQQSRWHEKAEQFRMLKENFRNLGMYEEEDLAYVEFKRAEAKAILEENKNAPLPRRLRAYLSFAGKNIVMDKMGHYATNPIRVLLSMLVVYLFFTGIYLILELFAGQPQIVSAIFESNDPHILNPIARAFYHSAITFLTIGYGDYYPNGLSRWVSALEGFIGLFMMSYFTVAFVRKILR